MGIGIMTQVAIFHIEVIICNLNVDVYIQVLDIYFCILYLDGHDEHRISMIPKFYVSMFSVEHNGHRIFSKNCRCVFCSRLHIIVMKFFIKKIGICVITPVTIFHCEVIICNFNVDVYTQIYDIYFSLYPFWMDMMNMESQ